RRRKCRATSQVAEPAGCCSPHKAGLGTLDVGPPGESRCMQLALEEQNIMKADPIMLLFLLPLAGFTQEVENPYKAEGAAQELRKQSLGELRKKADDLAMNARTAVDFATLGEIYKRLETQRPAVF